jgi:hypothetical protein
MTHPLFLNLHQITRGLDDNIGVITIRARVLSASLRTGTGGAGIRTRAARGAAAASARAARIRTSASVRAARWRVAGGIVQALVLHKLLHLHVLEQSLHTLALLHLDGRLEDDVHAHDVGRGKLLGGVGRRSVETHLERSETIQHHAVAQGKLGSHLGDQGADHSHHIRLGKSTAVADVLTQLLGVDGVTHYGTAIDLTLGLGTLTIVHYFSVFYTHNQKN